MYFFFLFLFDNDQCQEDQFTPMVLQRVRSDPSTERLRPPRCRDSTGSYFDIQVVENVRFELECRRSLWRDRRVKGQIFQELVSCLLLSRNAREEHGNWELEIR